MSVGGLAIAGCASDGKPVADDTIPSYVPLVEIQDGETHEVSVSVFCGADYLPIPVNNALWRAEDVDENLQYWVPAEWSAVAATVDDTSDVLVVQVQMQSNKSRLLATANGRSVTYRPATLDDPANVCE